MAKDDADGANRRLAEAATPHRLPDFGKFSLDGELDQSFANKARIVQHLCGPVPLPAALQWNRFGAAFRALDAGMTTHQSAGQLLGTMVRKPVLPSARCPLVGTVDERNTNERDSNRRKCTRF